MNSKGYTGKELLIVIMVMGLLTMVIVGSTSNAYKDKTEIYYDEMCHAIEKQAVLYGKTLDNLKEKGTMMITLEEVIDAGYYVTEDGNVKDPRNENNSLNSTKIKLIYEKGKVKAEIVDEE